ncbi:MULTISPECIES: hypothetical protein [unclassified Microcoleus]|uniref:hypothetical protein n=1 Tax=unclassified Microcoleus TaxID=2642155 RepID=UPI002FCF1298
MGHGAWGILPAREVEGWAWGILPAREVEGWAWGMGHGASGKEGMGQTGQWGIGQRGHRPKRASAKEGIGHR